MERGLRRRNDEVLSMIMKKFASSLSTWIEKVKRGKWIYDLDFLKLLLVLFSVH